jgi:hypothetical protein
MKDAKGHGSDTRGGTHASKVDQVGRPILSPKVVQGILGTPPGQGFTMQLKDGEAPPKGYQVAIPGHALAKPLGSGGSGEAELQSWAMQHADALKKAGHVGGYNNETTGNFEIEPSQNIGNRNAAIRTGTSRNQVSIWDNRKGREIKTGGTGA